MSAKGTFPPATDEDPACAVIGREQVEGDIRGANQGASRAKEASVCAGARAATFVDSEEK
jgi:hypothetical protein